MEYATYSNLMREVLGNMDDMILQMNNKKIMPHECSFRTWGDGQSEYLNSSCASYSSKEIWGAGKINSDSFGSFASSVEAALPSTTMPPNFFNTGAQCVGSTPAAFYVVERLMGFPRIDDQFDTLPQYSQSEYLEHPPFRNRDIQISPILKKQNDAGLCSRDTLEPIVKFPVHNNCHSVVFDNHPQNCIVECNMANYSGKNPSLQFENVKGLSKISPAIVPSKTRIRWSQDLHEKFVESVNLLGGADKATPKGILRLMNSEGLTIFHVKSHLQKYRTAKHIPDSSVGKPERMPSTSESEQLDSKTGMQINEALRMQLEVQKRLHEQLEIQRKLQLRIEEQGRKLQEMFKEQMKANGNVLKLENSDTLVHEENTGMIEDFRILSPEEGSNTSRSPSKIS